MAEQEEREENQDPAPIKHVDAERVSPQESERVPPGEDEQSEGGADTASGER